MATEEKLPEESQTEEESTPLKNDTVAVNDTQLEPPNQEVQPANVEPRVAVETLAPIEQIEPPTSLPKTAQSSDMVPITSKTLNLSNLPIIQLYTFESINKETSYNLKEEKDFETLLDRLNIKGMVIDKYEYMLISSYYDEVIEKIKWYRKRLKRESFVYWSWILLTVLIGLLSILIPVLIVIFFKQYFVNAETSALLSQIALFSGGAYNAIKLFNGTIKNKNRFAIFNNAYFSLKDLMYKFEENFFEKDKVFTVDNKFTKEFTSSLKQALEDARDISKKERDEFYNTFKTDAEITASIESLNTISSDMTTLVKAAIPANLEQKRKDILEKQQLIEEKTTKKTLLETNLNQLNKQNLPADQDKIKLLQEQIKTITIEIDEIKIDVKVAQSGLNFLLKNKININKIINM